MKRIDQQEIENENKNETGAVLPQGPPQENPSWENDPNTKRTYKTSYNLIRGARLVASGTSPGRLPTYTRRDCCSTAVCSPKR